MHDDFLLGLYFAFELLVYLDANLETLRAFDRDLILYCDGLALASDNGRRAFFDR